MIPTLKDFSKVFGMDLSERSRKTEHVWARFACYYYLRRKHGMTFIQIGEMFGYNHAAVINGVRQFEEKLSINDKLAKSFLEKVHELEL